MRAYIIILFFSVFLIGCAAEAETIQVGFMAPLSGDSAQLGQNALAAAELAAEEVNAAGGINGQPLELIVEDGACDERTAQSAGSKLLTQDNVPVIIGSICSRETMSFAPLAEEMQRVVVSYGTSAPALREAGDFIFRTTPNAIYQGAFAAEHIAEQGYEKVGILSCSDDWCSGISDAFAENFEAYGTVVGREEFNPGETDIRTLILKLQEQGPQAVYFVARATSTIAGMQQIQTLGWDVYLFGADTWDDASVRGQHPNARYAIIYADLPQEFVDAMQARGAEATVASPQAYDTVHIVANILRETTNPVEIRDALYSMEPYEGISGTIEFDEKGDILESQYAIREV